MLELEYRVGFRVIKNKTGFLPTLKAVIPATFKSLKANYGNYESLDEIDKKKSRIKNHFKLLAFLYKELQKQYGVERTNEIMHEVLMKGGKAFFRGFKPLCPGDNLMKFVNIYKDFEQNNIVFDVIEESEKRFEIVIRRCLIYEAFNELGLGGDLTRWMCDIAVVYFRDYHPKIEYMKDRMIARGDDSCHEVFVWQV
jgi:hypothetical protein